MILDRFRLDDQVAVVTGAGRGIGAATAVALAQAGADVVISARTEDQLQAVAAEIDAAGRRAHVVPADLSDLDAVAALAPAAQEAFGRLDIVVTTSAARCPAVPRHVTPPPDGGVLLERRHRARPDQGRRADHARERRWLGRVDVVDDGPFGARGFVAYGTAKGALSHWTRLAAEDLAPRIRVNAIAVGSVATSALEVVLTDDALRTTMEDTPRSAASASPPTSPAAVVYLSSEAGAYVTGKVVEVDGGLLMPNLDLGLPDL